MIPNAETIPARTPCPALREATYNISLPGVMFNRKLARAKSQK
jgi:hypothetical protein